MIKIKLTKTNFFTRWPCTVCGGSTEKVGILAQSDPKTEGEAVVRVCETCLQRGGIDDKLEGRAQSLEAFAAYVRSLKGRLDVPSFSEWEAKEAEDNASWEECWPV